MMANSSQDRGFFHGSCVRQKRLHLRERRARVRTNMNHVVYERNAMRSGATVKLSDNENKSSVNSLADGNQV